MAIPLFAEWLSAMLTILVIFFIFGTIFGSFCSVLIERWYRWTSGIVTGRSECPNCHHILWARDLFPLLSYLSTQGRCRYCKKNIDIFYPVCEVMMGIIFMLITISIYNAGVWVLSFEHILWLILWGITGLYILYDIRHMEIPDQWIIPGIYLSLIVLFISPYSLILGEDIFHTFHTWTGIWYDHLLWAVILYTFFYIQILIPGIIFLMKHKNWKSIWELCVSYFIFPFSLLISPFIKNTQMKDEIEIPTWIGWGDLRVAIFIGLTLGTFHGIFAIWVAYMIWGLIWITALVYGHFTKKKIASRIAFWPFLGIWWIISILLYDLLLISYDQILWWSIF